MRIISGNLGGRQFESPRGHRTHPMSEKARGALFSTLGDITDLTVLDGFAGSGALCFEAVSRGAKQATAIDIDKNAHTALQKNVELLGLDDKVKVVRANASGWSDKNRLKFFDLVFADPPYNQPEFMALEKLARNLDHKGVFVLSWPKNEKIPNLKGLELIKNKSYGDAQLAFYQKISP